MSALSDSAIRVWVGLTISANIGWLYGRTFDPRFKVKIFA